MTAEQRAELEWESICGNAMNLSNACWNEINPKPKSRRKKMNRRNISQASGCGTAFGSGENIFGGRWKGNVLGPATNRKLKSLLEKTTRTGSDALETISGRRTGVILESKAICGRTKTH